MFYSDFSLQPIAPNYDISSLITISIYSLGFCKEVHEFVIFACYVVCSELLVGYVVSSTN
jgi:hypothetical protein